MNTLTASAADIQFYDGESAPAEPAPHPASTSALAEAVTQLDADLAAPEEVELPAERERTMRAPNFTRMPVSWHGDHAPMMTSINAMAKAKIEVDFADLFALRDAIEQAARTVDQVSGELRINYAAIPESLKESWMLELSTRLLGWRQQVAVYWGEAMMAKVIRQEMFTTAYLGVTGRSTVEDRTQAGQGASLQEYYFAVLCALLHKHADAACVSAEHLCQRLKDACAR